MKNIDGKLVEQQNRGGTECLMSQHFKILCEMENRNINFKY